MTFKNVYIVYYNNEHYFCKTRHEVMNVMNDKIKRAKPFTIKSVNHYLYNWRSPNSKIALKIEKISAYEFYEQYINTYLNSIKNRLDICDEDTLHRLKLRYVKMIEPIVLKCKNENKDKLYIDEQVKLSYPLFNEVF